MNQSKTRLDKYLWAIRIFKTRTIASHACDAGHVKMNGTTLKAAKAVTVGDTYEIKKEGEKMIIKVITIIQNRVAYSDAIQHYIDMTPEDEKVKDKPIASNFYTGKRMSKVGRPTKQKRRKLDDFLDT